MGGMESSKTRVKPTLARKSTLNVPQSNRRQCPVCEKPLHNGTDDVKFGTVVAKCDGMRVIGLYHSKHDD